MFTPWMETANDFKQPRDATKFYDEMGYSKLQKTESMLQEARDNVEFLLVAMQAANVLGCAPSNMEYMEEEGGDIRAVYGITDEDATWDDISTFDFGQGISINLCHFKECPANWFIYVSFPGDFMSSAPGCFFRVKGV